MHACMAPSMQLHPKPKHKPSRRDWYRRTIFLELVFQKNGGVGLGWVRGHFQPLALEGSKLPLRGLHDCLYKELPTKS